MTNFTVTAITKLGSGAEAIDTFEAGAITKIGQVRGKADAVTDALIKALFEQGIRGNDWRKGKDMPEAHKKAYAERLAFYGQAVWTKEEKAELALPAPKKENFETEGDFLVAQKARKALQDKPSTKMKNLAKRFDTLAKQNGEIETPAGNPKTPKTGMEVLSSHIQNALKTLQGDKAFPDTFEHDEAVAILMAFQKKFRLETGKPVDIDSII